MSRFVPVVALLAGSEVIGILLGEWFFHLFRQTIPPLMLSNFNASAAHAGFVVYGAGAGVLIFVWSLIASFLSRLMWRRPSAETVEAETSSR